MSRLRHEAVRQTPRRDRGPGNSVTDNGDAEEKGKAGHVNWNGIRARARTHKHARTRVYINRYSVKTAGTVTLGSYKVHLSVGTK